jgi:hypothetical protein
MVMFNTVSNIGPLLADLLATSLARVWFFEFSDANPSALHCE